MFLRSAILPKQMLGDRALPLVIAVNVFLAGLTILTAVTVIGTVDRWSGDVARLASVQLPPGGNGDAAAEAVLSVLAEDPDIVHAQRLDEKAVSELLAPWLGTGNAVGDLPIPQIIDIELSPQADVAALRARLEAEFPGIVVDDHADWQAKTARIRTLVYYAAGFVILLIILAGVIMIVFTTRANLRDHHHLVETMHLIGATDAFTALQFQKHFLGLGIQGGLLGAVPVFAVTFGLARFAEYQPDLWLPGNGVPLINYSVLILPPVIAALLTMATARIAVLRILRQMN